jgi:hypothetical protein
MWLEGLDKLRKFNYVIGNRTRDLPACRIVPQPQRYGYDYYKFLILTSNLLEYYDSMWKINHVYLILISAMPICKGNIDECTNLEGEWCEKITNY